MAKLPSPADLGGLPGPDRARPIATLDGSRAGLAIESGAQSLGLGADRLAAGLMHFQNAQDSFDLSQRQANFEVAKTELDSQYANDTDFATREQRYGQDLEKLKAKVLEGANDRVTQLFGIHTDPVIARGVATQKAQAYKDYGDHAIATTLDQGDKLIDSAIAAQDPETRTRIIDTQAATLDSLVAQNLISPQQARAAKKKFVHDYAWTLAQSKINNASVNDGSLDAIDKEIGAAGPYLPPGSLDRSRFATEIAANPALRQRLQTIVQGEVGHNAPEDKKLIQLETIFNRAAARGQSLDQVTKEYTGPGSDGYYPSTTFTGGAIRNQQEFDNFQPLMDKALGGSDRSSELLGFPATGNASDQPGNTVASNGIRNGKYTAYKWHGPELYVQEGHTDNINRLESTRVSARQGDQVAQNADGTASDASAPSPFSFLSPLEREELRAKIATAKRAQLFDMERQNTLAKQQALQDTANQEIKLLQSMTSKDPQVSGGVTAQSIANDPVFTKSGEPGRAAIERLTGLVQRSDKDENSYGSGFYDLFKRIHAPADDPSRITDPAALAGHVNKGGDLTVAGYTRLLGELAGKRTPEGASEAEMKRQFLANARGQITGTNEGLHLKDPKGDELYLKFMAQALPAYDRGRAEGKSAAQLLNPDSADYIGKSITQFKRPIQQWTSDMMSAVGGSEAGDFKTPQELVIAVQTKRISRAEGEKIALKNGWIRSSDQSAPAPQVSVPMSQ